MQQKSNPDAGGHPSRPHPGFFPSCKAGSLRFSLASAQCLSNPPITCPYRHSSIWGPEYYCYHPHWPAIVEQTNQPPE